MAWYRMYSLDPDGKILEARDLEGADDGAAVEMVRRALAASGRLGGFELWQGRRLVHKEERKPG